MKRINQIEPWWLRATVLALIGSPLITGWPLGGPSSGGDSFELLMRWLMYGSLLLCIVALNTGSSDALDMLGAAFAFGITMAILGGAVRMVPFFEGARRPDSNLRLILLLIKVSAAIPFFIFAVSSFDAAKIVVGVSEQSSHRRGSILHAALALRIFQHAFEVFQQLSLVWREQNPSMFLPRHRNDWSKTSWAKVNFISWASDAVMFWATAWLMYTLEPIPGFVEQFTQVRDIRRSAEEQAI